MAVDGDVRAVVMRVLEERRVPGVASAYLFGSHAEGRPHRESDVDVGVLLDRAAHPTREERFDARVRLSSELTGALRGANADVVVLNDVPPLFGRHVIHRGVRVFCDDKALDHDFVRDVQLLAADLEPFIQRMRRIKLEALAR